MEDELGQEGLDEEGGKPQPAKAKGSPMKMIIIGGAFVVIAVVLVFFGPLSFILGEPPEEGEEATVVTSEIDTDYGMEYLHPEVIHTMLDERGRVKNLVINATFETSSGTVGLLTIRYGLITDIIQGEFSNFAFKKILDPTVQDTLKAKIRDKVNLFLPVDRDGMVKRVFLQIVTQ